MANPVLGSLKRLRERSRKALAGRRAASTEEARGDEAVELPTGLMLLETCALAPGPEPNLGLSEGQLIAGTGICRQFFKVISSTCYQQEVRAHRLLR